MYSVNFPMCSWSAILLMIVFTVVIHITKSEDDGVSIKYDEEHDPTLKNKVRSVTNVTPDIDPLMYSANNFDYEDAFEKKLIKSNAKQNDVKSAINR